MKNSVELFLFVNPMGDDCYRANKNVQEFIKNYDGKASLRIIPFVNFKNLNIANPESLQIRNQCFIDAYRSSLAFLAASMQGKKKGLDFLYELQVEFNDRYRSLTNELLLEIIDRLNIDKEMFIEDIKSDFTKYSFRKCLNLANNMNVEQTPTCILSNVNENQAAYKIEGTIPPKVLSKICNGEKINVSSDVSISIL